MFDAEKLYTSSETVGKFDILEDAIKSVFSNSKDNTSLYPEVLAGDAAKHRFSDSDSTELSTSSNPLTDKGINSSVLCQEIEYNYISISLAEAKYL